MQRRNGCGERAKMTGHKRLAVAKAAQMNKLTKSDSYYVASFSCRLTGKEWVVATNAAPYKLAQEVYVEGLLAETFGHTDTDEIMFFISELNADGSLDTYLVNKHALLAA